MRLQTCIRSACVIATLFVLLQEGLCGDFTCILDRGDGAPSSPSEVACLGSIAAQGCYQNCSCSGDSTASHNLVGLSCSLPNYTPDQKYFYYYSINVVATTLNVSLNLENTVTTEVVSTRDTQLLVSDPPYPPQYAGFSAILPNHTVATAWKTEFVSAVIPCVSQNFVITATTADPSTTSVYLHRWALEPNAGSAFLSSTLYVQLSPQEDFIPVKNVPLDVQNFAWTHASQCVASAMYIRNQFVYPNGTLGPECVSTSPVIKFFLNKAPSTPGNVKVASSSLELPLGRRLSMSWDDAEYTGGCDLTYEIKVSTRGNVIGTTSTSGTTIDIVLDQVMTPNTRYDVSVVAVTSVGSSKKATTSAVTNQPRPSNDGLTSGQAAGVAIGCILVAGLAVLTIVVIIRRRRMRQYAPLG